MKKLLCVILSVFMLLSLGTVAFAEDISLESMGVTYLVPDGKYVNDFSSEDAVSIADVEAMMSSADYEAVRDMGLTAVICMNEYQTEWAKAVVNGIKAVFEPLNIEIITVMDAGFSAPQGATDLEQAVEMKPDIILCYDQEPDTVKDSTKKAAAQGTKVTFFACAAADCANNEDYFGVVSGDNYTMGYLSGKRIAEAIGGEGEVAVVPTNFMSNDMRTRYEGALAALGEYEGISLITDQSSGFSTEECADLGEQIIMAHPNLKGYWGQWDELSVAAVSAMRSLGFEVVGSGPDLASSNTAANMAADGGFVGTGAFSAYSLGVGGGLCAAAAQAGKTVPDQVTIPIVEVTKENLLDTYFLLFHEDLPKQVIKMLS